MLALPLWKSEIMLLQLENKHNNKNINNILKKKKEPPHSSTTFGTLLYFSIYQIKQKQTRNPMHQQNCKLKKHANFSSMKIPT